jgi:uncharacterized membrane protein YwzB
LDTFEKKRKNQNKSLKSKCLIFALTNIVSNEFIFIYFITWCLSIIWRAFIKAHYWWKFQSFIIQKYIKKMDNICVRLYMIIVSYVYKKHITIIKHRFTNFKGVKRMDSQISNIYDYTWQHDFWRQNWISWNPQVQNMSFLKDHANYTKFHK